MTTTARITERGNGFPRVGDYVADDSGDLYEITWIGGAIHTDRPAGNYCYAHVTTADWSDIAEGAEHSATADEISAQ